MQQVLPFLRNLVGVRRLAVSREMNRVFVRSTFERLELAELLLPDLDRPRSEVAVDVELLWLKDEGSALTLALQPGLNIVEGTEGFLHLREPLPGSSGVTATLLDFQIRVRPQVRINEDEVILYLRIYVDAGASPHALGKLAGSREIRSSVRLGDGESRRLSFLKLPETAAGEIAVVVSPRILRRLEPTEDEKKMLWIGLSDDFDLRGQRQLTSSVAGPLAGTVRATEPEDEAKPSAPSPPESTPTTARSNLELIGIVTLGGRRIAALRDGERIVHAGECDVLRDEYVVQKITPRSVTLGFVGRPEKEPMRVEMRR